MSFWLDPARHWPRPQGFRLTAAANSLHKKSYKWYKPQRTPVTSRVPAGVPIPGGQRQSYLTY